MIQLLEFVLGSWGHFLGTLTLIIAIGWAIGQFRPVRVYHHDE